MKIYTELDALLDTKYPIIKDLTDINPKEYMVRKNNNFKYIGADLFNYIFSYRQNDVLKSSAPTLAIDLIKEMLTYNKMDQQMDGIKETSYLIINTYPFKLDEDELKDLREIYHIQMKRLIEVDMIYKEPDIKFILSHDGIVVFDGMEIIDKGVREAELDKHNRPSITLVCAASIDDITEMDDYNKTVGNLMTQFTPFINIQMVGVNMFSGVFLE